MTFRTKLILCMCGLVLLTGASILFVADRSSRQSTGVLVDSLFREVSAHAATQTKDFVLRAAPVAESLKELTRTGLAIDDLDKLSHQLLAFLQGNPGMTWVLYGDETGSYTGATRLTDGSIHIERTFIKDGKTHLTEFQVQPDASWKTVKTDDNAGYDPRARPWYQLAKQKRKIAWTQPYMFFTQGVPGISCVNPVYSPAGDLRGVFSVEFDLNALSKFVASTSVSPHSRVFLFTPAQTLIAHENQKNMVGTGVKGKGELLTLADTGDPLVEAFRTHLRPDTLTKTGFHFFEFTHAGTGYLGSTTVFTIDDTQTWVVGAVAPQSDFLAAVWRTRWWALWAALGALCLAIVLAAWLARRVSRPVQALIQFMKRVGEGDLESKAELGGSKEFRELSVALNHMISDLNDRLRLRHSLDVAMDVQQQLLPRKAPTIAGFDIAGHSTYCDETGGDYYDFMVVDEPQRGHMLIALGDVMGHGVAAALVMAGTRAVLRDRAGTSGGLADLMGRLNRMIAADLEGKRFMTMHLGILDTPERVYRWCSAGHDPPIIYDPATKSFSEPEGGSMPLGVMDDTAYDEEKFGPLTPGQILVLGTDGVWEMPDATGEQFGKDRLKQVIESAAEGTADQISKALRAALTAFRGQVKSVDDVTFVILKTLPVPQQTETDAIETDAVPVI